MYISRMSIENYKSFFHADVEPSIGINMVAGQNNAGKTALLEAMGFDFVYRPHRSTLTIPTPGNYSLQNSTVTVTVCLSRDELLNMCRAGDMVVPLPPLNHSYPGGPTLSVYNEHTIEQFRRWFFGLNAYTFEFSFVASAGTEARPQLSRHPSFGLYSISNHSCRVHVSNNKETIIRPPTVFQSSQSDECG